MDVRDGVGGRARRYEKEVREGSGFGGKNSKYVHV